VTHTWAPAAARSSKSAAAVPSVDHRRQAQGADLPGQIIAGGAFGKRGHGTPDAKAPRRWAVAAWPAVAHHDPDPGQRGQAQAADDAAVQSAGGYGRSQPQVTCRPRAKPSRNAVRSSGESACRCASRTRDRGAGTAPGWWMQGGVSWNYRRTTNGRFCDPALEFIRGLGAEFGSQRSGRGGTGEDRARGAGRPVRDQGEAAPAGHEGENDGAWWPGADNGQAGARGEGRLPAVASPRVEEARHQPGGRGGARTKVRTPGS